MAFSLAFAGAGLSLHGSNGPASVSASALKPNLVSAAGCNLASASALGVVMMVACRAVRRRMVASSRRAAVPEKEAESSPSSFWDAATVNLSGRRALIAATTAAAAAAIGADDAAEAAETDDQLWVDKSVCQWCFGSGYNQCNICKGTGQFRTTAKIIGEQVTKITCPVCGSLGNVICKGCIGTGMNKADMRGCMRDPAFRKVLLRIGNYNSLNLGNLQEFQNDVAEAKAKRAARIAKEKAENAKYA